MTPLILVVGFLGAGKTTLVRRMLLDGRARDLKVGVIVNEFGAVDVDGALLRDAARDLASIAGGCACCAGQDDFVEAVETMSDGRFDCLVVEASGLADPIVLMESLAAPQLLKRVQTTRIICVADASNWSAMAGALGPLMRRQLMLADTIILSKTDLVSEAARAALHSKIAQLNPRARVQTAAEESRFALDSRADSPAAEPHAEPRANSPATPHANSPATPHAELPAAPHAGSHTIWIALPHPVERAALDGALSGVGADVWRAKGFVRLRGESGLQLVQLTGSDDAPRHRIAPFAPAPDAPEPELGLVFIGGGFDIAPIQRDFGALNLTF